jgi:hypothetical protein
MATPTHRQAGSTGQRQARVRMPDHRRGGTRAASSHARVPEHRPHRTAAGARTRRAPAAARRPARGLTAAQRRRRRTYPALVLLAVVVALVWAPWRAEPPPEEPVVPSPRPGTTQNGWDAITDRTDPHLVPFPWVTGRVLEGDVYTVLAYVAERFHAEVEPIDPESSWGWEHRAVRGEEDGDEGGVLSNHASGTAIDLNAPDHPLGEAGTFTDAQVERLRAILADVAPVVAWGGDFDRADEMHLEIVGSPDQVAEVAARIADR